MNKVKASIRCVMSWLFVTLVKQTSSKCQLLKVNFDRRTTSGTRVGEDVSVNGCLAYGRGKIIIGDNFHSGKGLKTPCDDTLIYKTTEIGDNAWQGMGVTLLPGVKIWNGAVVQAWSVLVKDIPALAIAGGHLALPFTAGDEGHYKRLIQERSFH